MHKQRGFTIVELLIVIVVIAILAAITIVAFSGIQSRATRTAALNEAVAWRKLFETYKATYGDSPAVATNINYCLGTGFPTGPNSGGVARCRDFNGTGTSSYPESDNTMLMTELAKVGALPQSKKTPINGTVGSYIYYGAASAVITIVIPGDANDCPAPTTYTWTDNNGRLLCTLTFSR